MSGTQGTAQASILAILVLYRLQPEQSNAFVTLVRAVDELSAAGLLCMIYDNSPSPHVVPATPFPCEYRHDPSNPGLAAAYQCALEEAQRTAIPWLLLLDQDTVLTTEYLAQLMLKARELRRPGEVSAIVPKLVQDGAVLSPHWPHGAADRRSFAGRSGVLESNICVYNSGALLRVEAVRASGGFPQDFPLDYLDHAMFAGLLGRGGRVYLLPVSLGHHLESKAASLGEELKQSARLRGILLAETRFYRRNGTRRDRLLLWRRRLRLAIGMLLRGQLRSLARLIQATLG